MFDPVNMRGQGRAGQGWAGQWLATVTPNTNRAKHSPPAPPTGPRPQPGYNVLARCLAPAPPIIAA